MRSGRPSPLLYAALAALAALLQQGCAAGSQSVHDLPRVGTDLGAWTAELEARMASESPTASLLGELALARMHQGRVAEAERLASRAMSRGQCDAVALAISARVAFARGVPEVAVRRYDEASSCALGALGKRA
ncbi:MAG: hypothetical protein QF464_17795, partial [Myxococcota bacterium]|nr:hypothetical protein [Myxococcota bacterium]